MELDEFLEGPTVEDTPAEGEANEAQAAEVAADPVKTEAETAEPAKEEEQPEATDTKEDVSMSETEKTIPIASYMAEKQKRQEYEAKLAELEKQQEQKPDFYEDPEGFIKGEMQKLESKSINDKVNMSVEIAKTVYKDFDEVVGETWGKLKEENPYLDHLAANSPNPGLFAYQQCKNHRALQEIGDPASFREKLETEIREKLMAELKDKQVRENLPESLASDPNAKGKDLSWSGPEPLDEIVG